MTERKFTTLRKRLDQLGYRQALGIESVPLVEKLFSDLVHTTESLKNVKLQLGKQEKERTVYEDNVEPYRSDNAKLVKENNELHLQLIKLREETDQVIRDLKTSVRKLEHENADLKFLNTQYVHKVKALEKENKSKTERIQDLQEKNLHAVVETPGGRRKQIPLRRQRMDIESMVSPARDLNDKADDVHDPYVADLLNVADTRIEDLQVQVSQLQDEKSSTERRNKSLRKQVESRDKEIERLNQLLDGGRPVDAVLRESKKDSSERVVAHLNVQVDYLQQANHDLEKQLKDTVDQKVEATRRANELEATNADLLLELKDLNRLSRQVEHDKERDVIAIQSELSDTKAVLNNLQHQEGTHRTEMQELRKERQRLMEENERLAVLMENAEQDVHHVTDLLDKSDKERKRLSERNAQLTINERELVMDLERLKLTKSVKPKKSRDKSPSKIESLMKTLEKERDYYKGECETLQGMMRKRLSASPPSNRKGSKSKGKVSRDSPSEVNRLRRERDELQSLVEKFEKHLTEIQENVKTLTQDRDNIQLLYEQATDEIQRLRRQVSQARSPSPSRAASAVLLRVESERDAALADLRRTNTQLDNLEDKLKVEADRNEMHARVTSLRNMVANLEDQLKQTSAQLSMAKDSALELESEVNKVQLTADQANRTAEDRERRLNRKAGELQASQEKCAQLERRLEEIEKRNEEQSFETAEIKASLKSLDRERDDLQQQVDEKTEEIIQMEAKKIQLEKAESELKMNMEDVEAQLSHALEQSGLKDREIKSLRRQLDSRDDELAEMTRGREVALKENRRLQADLNTMTEEHQSLHQQLQDALEEQESLKVQIAEYARQVARVEELLAQKEQEKEELLGQYRVLSGETERLVSESKASAGQVNNYHMELIQKERSEMELSDKIRRLESEIQQYGASHQAYEIEVSSLTRSLAQMEEQVRLANEDRESMMQDLSAVRELCMKLDQTRESLSRQLAAKSLDHDQVFSEKEAVRSLEGVLAKQREKEFVGKKSLETTLEEVDRLKDKLAKTDEDRSYQRQEVNTLRKASERLEDEVAKLKKKLANEKFERERLLQETSRKERDITGSASRESLTGLYSRNTEQRLHTSFSSGEFARLKPKDMSSPLASDHSDTGRRLISPIRRRSVDDVSFIRL
ncbi:hypothetical protein pdam_00012554 [Pocillopora damicornis]|uniref:Centrosomal protein of 135 kDa n=1 Tax=Pocillopora damicornis TaxID=46731 RepID=A0A3M6TUE4_POCDA|nr:hypothetical protein pdam_00012554 [Pocillopora damicornis]